jgi:entericidin B
MILARVLVLLGLLSPLLAACNTMEGLGQDVQSGGRSLERSADDTQKKM